MSAVRARAALCFGLMCGAAALLSGCPSEMTPEDKEFFESMYGSAGGSGSGGAGSGGSGVAGCDAPATVFRAVANGCDASGCHDATTKQSGLDLSVPDPFDSLLDKATDKNGAGSACMASTALIVDSANPEQSLLYTKITPNLAEVPCGSPMPFPLGPTDNGVSKACVLDWIEAKLAAP